MRAKKLAKREERHAFVAGWSIADSLSAAHSDPNNRKRGWFALSGLVDWNLPKQNERVRDGKVYTERAGPMRVQRGGCLCYIG